MTDHHSSSSSSSPQPSQESTAESLQSLKVTPEEKTGTIPSSIIAMEVALSLKQLQVNVLGHETYKVHKK